MNYTDEEVQLISAWNDARKAFVEAKENKKTEPVVYEQAKAAMTAMRTEWRGIREMFPPEPAADDGNATITPESISTTATAQEIARATKGKVN